MKTIKIVELSQSIKANFSFNNYYSNIHQYGIKNAVDKISNSEELTNIIDVNGYFYFKLHSFHASSSFQLFALDKETYLTGDKSNKYTREQLLNILKNK